MPRPTIFLIEFKYKIAKKMEENVVYAEKNLSNMKHFLEENDADFRHLN